MKEGLKMITWQNVKECFLELEYIILNECDLEQEYWNEKMLYKKIDVEDL